MKILLNNSNSNISDICDFEAAAEKMLKLSSNTDSHIMIVFGIDNFNEINAYYGHSAGTELLSFVCNVLNSYVTEPNLYCQLHSESFAIFLENYKDIDLALLAIQLTEEISGFNKNYDTKISFGTCKASPTDQSISSLCSRALYARRTIKIDARQLLADYNEIVHA